MVCNKCGAQCSVDTLFCTSCGNRLAAQQSQPQNNYQQPYRQQPPQNVYQQPPIMQQVPPVQYPAQKTEPVTSIGKYLLWWFIGLIPLVGFILTIVFAVDNSDMNRANFFRTQLIIMAISILAVILFFVAMISAGVNMINDFADIFENIEYLI